MSRGFQFSLRALLGMAGLACLLLGGWHLLVQYGQFVQVAPLEANKPLEIACGFVLLSTEHEEICRLNVLRNGVNVYQYEWLAKSRVPFVYRGHLPLQLGLQPGSYVVESYPPTRPYPAASCAFVLPAKD